MEEDKGCPEKEEAKDTDQEVCQEIDPTQILLQSRNVLLYGTIDDDKAYEINEKLLALSCINNDPIALWINSCGGGAGAGWAIIDMMNGLSCPVYTFISGRAYSMATVIALAGDKRVMTSNSSWMAHGGRIDLQDDIDKILDRVDFLKKHAIKRMLAHYKKHTKFSGEDLEKIKEGELWLTPTQAKKKGVVDLVTGK